MPQPPRTGRTARNTPWWLLTLWLIPFMAGAAALWSWAWPMQYERACWMQEWPFETGCPAYPGAGTPGQPSAVYQQHLQNNPGDSRALGWLTGAFWAEENPQTAQLLSWSKQLAPNQSSVLVIEAESQLQAENWDAAAKVLINLLEQGHKQARPMLVALMTKSEETAQAVLAQLSEESTWLDGVLANLGSEVPANALQPFIGAGRELGLLKPATVLALVDRLKRERNWIDAYSLWVAWRGEVPLGLYNGNFDRPVMRRGFDWEWVSQPMSRQGFRVDQVSASSRPGWALEVNLTGRASLPPVMVSQAMVLPGPRYRLSGQVMVDRLSAKEGLVWALRCAAGSERFAQSTPILDTERRWQPFSIEFQPPPQCGAAVRLNLEPKAQWEARAGMVGTVFFDDMVVESLNPATAASGQLTQRTPHRANPKRRAP
ncbi:hypothetical protein K3217_24135 [bacterium BD-1]|nr:hypothetical protein [Ottowia caeni]